MHRGVTALVNAYASMRIDLDPLHLLGCNIAPFADKP